MATNLADGGHLRLGECSARAAALGCRIGARPLALAENAPVASAPPEIRLYTNAAMTKYLAYYLRRGYNRYPPSPAGRLPPGLLPQAPHHLNASSAA